MLVVGLETLFAEAWDLITNETTGRIAICGPGGIGKTTLMRQIYDKLAVSHHFELLIWVTVSSNATEESVWEHTAKRIGLVDREWVRRSDREKFVLIYFKLKRKRFVLFLDDMWKKFGLYGVPRVGVAKTHMLIFTSRSQSVVEEMKADSILKMPELSMYHSWRLFQSKVGRNVLADPEISELSEIFVRKCGGLPLLLCTVGRAMANRKSSEEWLSALEKIKRLECKDSMVNGLLLFCFESLPYHRVKCCLVYFSLFPEDFSILRNDLIDFWICEHLLDEDYTGDDSLDMGYVVVDTLVSAGLLEEEHVDNVKLLDSIREFASSVAIECQMFRNAQLLGATEENLLTYAGWPSTMGDIIRKLSKKNDNLLTLLLDHNPFILIKDVSPEGYSQLVGTWYSSVHVLTVLDLSHSGIDEVPSEISKLFSLQYLNLSHTWISRLPIELQRLKKLKCLNLECNDQLRVLPKQLINGLCSLQILKMFRCGYSVEPVEDNILSIGNADMYSLLCLERLKVLSITTTSARALLKFLDNSKFLRCTQSLSLEVLWGSTSLDISPLAVMKNLLTLEIHQAEVLEELNCQLHHAKLSSNERFIRLQKIALEQCSSLRDLTWVNLVPNLKVLGVKNCENMEEIIKPRQGKILEGGDDPKLFAKLEILKLESLPKLKTIYRKALPFRCLKHIVVIDCSILRRLPLNKYSSNLSELVIEAEKDWWYNIVEWENEVTKRTFSPCFKQFML